MAEGINSFVTPGRTCEPYASERFRFMFSSAFITGHPTWVSTAFMGACGETVSQDGDVAISLH